VQWTLTLGGTVYHGRPLSAEAVRVTHRDLGGVVDRAGETAVLSRLMRKSFPLRWVFLWIGDPVRKFLRHPGRNALLAAFLTVPAEKVEPPREPDEWDKLEAMQRVESAGGPPVTLDTVCRLTEAAMGAEWYWNPDRWDTWDGYAPYDVVWRAWTTMQQARAFERLNMIRAVGVTKAGDKAGALYDADVREALGG
jgi:hypothetical protein